MALGRIFQISKKCESVGLTPFTGVMMKNAEVTSKRASVTHAKKRFLADCLIAAKPDLSNRELARAAGVSHTYMANRRRVAQSGNN